MTHSHVRWDEAAIAEHDKERGTRMVINEPDTPFVRPPTSGTFGEEDGDSPKSPIVKANRQLPGEQRVADFATKDDASETEVRLRLEKWLHKAEDGQLSPTPTSMASPCTGFDKFAAKRKQHYNEVAMIKKMKEHAAQEDDDDEDSDEEENRSDQKKADVSPRRDKMHYNEVAMLKQTKEVAEPNNAERDSSLSS